MHLYAPASFIHPLHVSFITFSVSQSMHCLRSLYATAISTLFVFAILTLTSPKLSAAELSPPNILFISIDDMNDWMGLLNVNPQAHTPNIDALAQQGTLFRNAHCPAPICRPSRAAILTGFEAGSMRRTPRGPKEIVEAARERGSATLDDYFRQHGYTTLAAGKIYHDDHKHPEQFDQFGGYGGEGAGRPRGAERNWTSSGTGTDWYVRDDETPDEAWGDYEVTTWGVERLQESHDKPFLLMIGLRSPHVAWTVTRKWADLYPTDSIWLPPYHPDDLEDVPEEARKQIRKEMPHTDWAKETGQWQNIVQCYAASISFVDMCVGRLVEALENSPYADNTIIVLWSDHGYHMGEKGSFQKHSLWQRSTRVPLIFAGPGIPANQTVDQAVDLVDIYPTLVQLAGLPANEKNQGKSLVPLLENPDAEGPWFAKTEYRGGTSIVQGYWHYIQWPDGEELYDWSNDFYEENNLADDPAYADKKEALRQLLE